MGPLAAVDLSLAVDPVALVVIGLGLLWYARAVRRVTRAGGHWPASRSIAAATAAFAAVLASNGWVAANDLSRFSAHATQHLLLALVVPLSIVLAAPLSLGLRTSTPPARAVVRRWSTVAPGAGARPPGRRRRHLHGDRRGHVRHAAVRVVPARRRRCTCSCTPTWC